MSQQRREILPVIGRSLRNVSPLRNSQQQFKLRHLTFEVTALCNSKCDMCHIWANQEDTDVLSTEEIRHAFSDQAFQHLEDIIFTGGELFLRDDVKDLVDIARMHNPDIVMTLSTNGLLFDKIIDTAEYCYEQGAAVMFGISIDGIGDAHDKRRRIPGNFDIIDQRVIPALKEIAKRPGSRISIGIGHCLDEYGLETIESVRQYCAEHEIGFNTQLIEDFDYYLPAKKRTVQRNNQVEAIDDRKNGFDSENRITKKDNAKIRNRDYSNVLKMLSPNVHHHRVIDFLEGNPPQYECSSLRNFMLLRSNGDVAPCLRFADVVFGNVRKTPLSLIVKQADYMAGVERVMRCDGCLNTWCTDWSMEENAFPFWRQIISSYAMKFSTKVLNKRHRKVKKI